MSYKYENFNKDLLVQNWIETEDEDLIRGLKELNEVYRKAEAFDEIRADSKMDIYDFELGEYVLKTIKVYESEAD